MLDDDVGDFVGTAAQEVCLRELLTTFFGPYKGHFALKLEVL